MTLAETSEMTLFRQLRVKEWFFVTLPALFGLLVNSLHGLDLGWCALILSMFLFNGFIFIYNDYEDAPYDKEDEYKRKRNVFCGEDRRKKTVGTIIIFAAPVLSILLGLSVSIWWALFALGLVVLAYLYSSPVFRAKERPLWDVVFHVVWISMMIVPGYLYLRRPDALFFVMWLIFATNSAIAQINNELRDLAVDSLAGHRTTVILLGRRRTFFLRWGLEVLLVCLIAWVALRYRYYVFITVVILSYLCFMWVERIGALDKLETIGDHLKIRIAYVLFLWLCVGTTEALLKKLFS